MLNITQQDFQRLVQYIHKNYGIDLSHKKTLIEGRLHNDIIKKGYNGFKDYLDFALNNNPAEMEHIINKLTTNHTYFMRESAHFDLFKNVILPNLEARKTDKVLSIWSAGCSSGQEPYTLSMILKDYFEKKPVKWDTRVLATDISQHILETAKKATYDEESLEDLPSFWKSKYFDKKDGQFTVKPIIRDNVIFRTFNLMSPINFRLKFDVIFCRNVMIYFDLPTKNALVQRFYNATANGGYLLIGHSETIDKRMNPYHYIDVASYIKKEY